MFFKIEANLVFSFFKDRNLVVASMEDFAGFILVLSSNRLFFKTKDKSKLRYRTKKEQNSTL